MIEHGFRWWPSILALRAVCACTDFYPCMRMRDRIRHEKQEEGWPKYADELLKDFGQFDVEPSDRTHRIADELRDEADQLRDEADQLMFRRPPPDLDAEIAVIEAEMQRRWPT